MQGFVIWYLQILSMQKSLLSYIMCIIPHNNVLVCVHASLIHMHSLVWCYHCYHG